MECEWDSVKGVPWAVEGFIALFYANNVLVASRYLELLQHPIDVLTELFEQVGLLTNTKKTQTMVCVPCKVQELLSLVAGQIPFCKGIRSAKSGVQPIWAQA